MKRRRTSPGNAQEPLFALAGAGHETRGDADYYYNARLREDRLHATLQLVLAGAGFYRATSGRERMLPGHAFFQVIPGPFEYGFEPGSKRALELVFVSVREQPAMDLYRRITSRFGHVLSLGAHGPIAEQMLWIAHAHEASRLPDRYETSAILYRLLMTIYSTLTQTRSQTSPRVSQAIQGITTNATNPRFNVEKLAQSIGCTREYLSRQFRSVVGMTPIDCLMDVRIRLAARALRSSDEKLEAIARRCGFSGANYLCRAFRQRTGVTPARFRMDRWRAIS